MKDSWVLKEVRMDYNTRKLPDWNNIETYPVTLVFDDNGCKFEIKIISLSVGYGGSGPTDFAEMLNFFGISYDESDIFTKRRMGDDGWIRLRYTVG
jgi:hypothetical protein